MKAACALTCFAALLPLATQAASPFPTRDQNPLLADFGLPMPLPSELPASTSWWLGSSFNWSSSAVAQTSEREALIVDAETRELRVTATRSLGSRLAVQLQLPYRYLGPGVLDGFIDDWHELFGLPEGARPLLPEDQLMLAYERDGIQQLHRSSSRSGFGNFSADIGARLIATPRTNTAVWLSVKLPTSSMNVLGQRTTDVSLSAVGEHRLGERWAVYGQASATYLGEDKSLGHLQNRTAWSGHAGMSVHAWHELYLKVQFDAHSALIDSDLDFLSDAVAASFGGSYRFDSGWLLDIGISEDISVDASPDVVFVLGVRKEVTGDWPVTSD